MSNPQSPTRRPIGNFYELSARIGYVIGVERFHEKEWQMSTGAQLSLLHSIASMLGLKEAETLLRPMVAERCDEDGNCYPDHLAKEGG